MVDVMRWITYLVYRRSEGMKADGAVEGVHPHGCILPLAAALSLSRGFYSSLARSATVHRHQNSLDVTIKRATELHTYSLRFKIDDPILY